MKGIATTAMAAMLLAGAAQAQQRAAPGAASRRPGRSVRQPRRRPAGPTIPTRVTAQTL